MSDSQPPARLSGGGGPGHEALSAPGVSSDAARKPALAPGAAGTPSTAAAPVAAAAASSHIAKKIQKALSLRVDAQTSRDSLKCLSGFFDENTMQTRRNLRATIEGQHLLLHQDFVDSFGQLEKRIESLDKLVNALEGACDRASSQLRQSKSATQAILERAAALRNESRIIDEKQEVLTHFLTRFRLSEADTQLLRNGERPLDEEFFCAFERLEQVRKNARELLNTCGQQTSGVDILHETSEILEASYERMFVWVQQQCRGPKSSIVAKASASDGEAQVEAFLKRVLGLLIERPVYFNHCVRDISRVRRQALVQRFFDALSQGDSSGNRPIELQASDPVRYVSDMLAWIHENAAAERHALLALMGRAARTSDGVAAADGGGAHPPEAALSEPGLTLVAFDDILDFTLEGLSTPFSTRVKQVLDMQSSTVVVYKVAQIFSLFAQNLAEATRREESCVVVMCRDLHGCTYQAFLDMWERQAQRLRQGVAGVYVSELSAPSFVIEAVNTLSQVLAIYESSLVPTTEREADFLPVLSAAFDPLLNHCQQVAAMMDTADGQVFLINCIVAMQAPLQKHDFTAQRVAMYSALLEDHVRHLVDGQVALVLSKLSLTERLQALRRKPPDAPLSSVPELHPVSLAATLRSFYNSLFTLGGVLALPVLERISSRSVRSEARASVARQIATAYEELYEGVKELDIATHTPDQVRTLLE
mmetsp:Transcript_68505/g.198745  ORF Transcript_68505/g.198745 Transcript_68505/m.198745 type:complete len:707 (-) Transcript_68505:38-2158(-)